MGDGDDLQGLDRGDGAQRQVDLARDLVAHDQLNACCVGQESERVGQLRAPESDVDAVATDPELGSRGGGRARRGALGGPGM